MTHISADVQRITLNASCMTISGGRKKQLDIFYRVIGFTSDFVSFIVVELIRFFHGTLQLIFDYRPYIWHAHLLEIRSQAWHWLLWYFGVADLAVSGGGHCKLTVFTLVWLLYFMKRYLALFNTLIFGLPGCVVQGFYNADASIAKIYARDKKLENSWTYSLTTFISFV